MSTLLWRFYLEDDADSFRRVLEEAGLAGGRGGGNTAQRNASGAHGQVIASASPGRALDSPVLTGVAKSHGDSRRGGAIKSFGDLSLGRVDINRRDGRGLTILHHACSSVAENAAAFALALIQHPLVDLYVQDWENGWTALHRAFYFGNISIARAIIEREFNGPGNASGPSATAPSLIRIKDKEGNAPYDLLTATIADRTLQWNTRRFLAYDADASSDAEGEVASRTSFDEDGVPAADSAATHAATYSGNDLYTFGSNRNCSLGFGDEDDRHFPERIHLKRPARLYHAFHRAFLKQKAAKAVECSVSHAERIVASASGLSSASPIPTAIRARPFVIRDVQMSKFHTAVLTDDPFYNLHICGHGLGGRLGTGNQKTQYTFVCLEDSAFARTRITAIALGQDHTLAVTKEGEIFSWGSNALGQLGIGLPKANAKPEECVQPMPKQLFGPLKKEFIVGVAASRIHSVAYTDTALFTWGKNEGQLGLVDAHAGSLEIQPTPRRVAASRISCNIRAVVAIERATIYLLENHEVHVLANFGAVKIQFPLDGFSHSFVQNSFRATTYDSKPNTICKITGGGDTICALSTSGEVFTLTVTQRLDSQSSSTSSTTNPNKIRAALSLPQRVWALKKQYMNAYDVGVDDDGSVIICTNSGSVWRRVRRPKIASSLRAEGKTKDFKFMRVPNLTRAVAVRASGSGAYSAIRKDCNVLDTLDVANASLARDVEQMHPFFIAAQTRAETSYGQRSLTRTNSDDLQEGRTAFANVIRTISGSKDPENSIQQYLRLVNTEYDMVLTTSTSDVQLPIHQYVLAGRSTVARQLLSSFRFGQVSSTEFSQLTCKDDGQVVMTFPGVDILTLFELITYLYMDRFAGIWLGNGKRLPELAFRNRQIKTELGKLASALELRNLESAVRRVLSAPTPCLESDFDMAFEDPRFFENCDVSVQLADGEMSVHSLVLAKRCPFFEGLFEGRAHGRWLAGRRDTSFEEDELLEVDLKHVETSTFKLVLRYIYADVREGLFDDVVAENIDAFLDVVMEVLSVANELMLDELSQACQVVLARHTNIRNVCQLLNAVSPSSVTTFKNVALEFMCLSLEALLYNHLLDELDEDLLDELDQVVRENQLALSPLVRSGRRELELHERYPELAGMLDRGRQAKLDSLTFADKMGEFHLFENRDDDLPSSVGVSKSRRRRSSVSSSIATPRIKTQESYFMDVTPVDDLAVSPLASLEPLPAPGMSPVTPRLGTSIVTASPENARAEHSEAKAAMPSTSRPWTTSPLQSTKLDMKEIMNQTSANRPSNLSLGLSAQAKSPPATSRMSQKQRKRQQQELSQAQAQAQAQASEKLDEPVRAAPAINPSSASPVPKSPWQVVNRPKVSLTSVTAENESPSRSFTTPQLTMRQTVAHSTPTKQRRASDQAEASSSLKSRAVSSPIASPTSGPSSSATSYPSKSPVASPNPVQSIRHIPRPQPDTSSVLLANQPLADIMSQEEAGKSARKEAAAKRNLQDIQQEQEFQEWWDKESKRVQEAAAKAARDEKRSRGGNPSASADAGADKRHHRRRGKGKGKETGNA